MVTIRAHRRALRLLAVATAVVSAVPGTAQTPRERLDALVGEWVLIGHVRDQPVRYAARGEWRLDGQWLLLRMQDLGEPSRYAADVYIAVDPAGAASAHWLDTFGAGPARTVGVGTMRGDTLDLRFEYPDGAMTDRFVLDRAAGSWTLAVDAADGAGGWRPFARYVARPAGEPHE